MTRNGDRISGNRGPQWSGSPGPLLCGQRILERRDDRNILRPSGRALTGEDALQGQDAHSQALKLVLRGRCVFFLERMQTIGREDDVDAVETLTTDRWPLQVQAGGVEAAGSLRRFSNGVPRSVGPEPNINVLRYNGGALEERCAETDDQIADAKVVESAKESALSGR